MKMVERLNTITTPVLLALGFFLMVDLQPASAENIAPYRYEEREDIDPLKLLERQRKFYLKRVKRSPNNGLDLAALANAYVAESNYTGDLTLMDKAEEAAKKSQEVLPFYNEGPKLTLAQVAESRHQFPEAMALAQEVYNQDQRNKAAIFTLVTTHLGYGQLEEAMNYANKLVEVSGDSQSYTMRALVYLAQGKNDEALADFNESLKREGPDEDLQAAYTRTLMGRYYYRSGNIEMAEAYTDSALSILPEYHLALAQKADIEVKQNNFDQAQELYEKAYEERQEPPYLLAHAQLLDSLNRPAKAKELRSEAEEAVRLEIETTPYGHYNELAQILIEGKEPEDQEEAIAAAKKNVEQRPTSEAHFLLAKAYAQSGKVEEARSSLQMAMATGETNVEYQELANEIGL